MTSDPDAHPVGVRYFLARDGHDIDTLWLRRRGDDDHPVALISRFDFPAEVRDEAWAFVRHAVAVEIGRIAAQDDPATESR